MGVGVGLVMMHATIRYLSYHIKRVHCLAISCEIKKQFKLNIFSMYEHALLSAAEIDIL